MVRIKVTDDKSKLWRIGGDDYAEAHAGKTYDAEIDDEGCATVEVEWIYNGSTCSGTNFESFLYETIEIV